MPRPRELPDRARVVIIGGGVGGASIAYHLAQQGERRTASGVRGFAEVGLQQTQLGCVVKRVVDGKVAEVKQAMAHAGVLPVDEQGAVGLGVEREDVAGQQIVVAGDRLGQRQHGRDPGDEILRRPVAVGKLTAALGDELCVVGEQIRDPKTDRQLQAAVMKRAQRRRRRFGCRAEAIAVDRAAGQVFGHQALVVGRRDGRSDPEPGRLLTGDSLGAPIDPEQLGVLAGKPDDTFSGSEPHPEVAVGDTAVKRHGLAIYGPKALSEPVHDHAELGHGLKASV